MHGGLREGKTYPFRPPSFLTAEDAENAETSKN